MMLRSNTTQKDLLQLNRASYQPMANNFLTTTLTKWAKIWVSVSNIPCKRKISPTEGCRETDIRSRINYYDQPQQQNNLKTIPNLTSSSATGLYRATCQKLRPNSNVKRLVYLGDILHVRKCWDNLEKVLYQDLSNSPHYVPPTQRLPFNPEKPGSIYLPRKSKRNLAAFRHLSSPKRQTFASSTIVYNNSDKNIIKVLPIVAPVPPQDDDDDVPLAALDLFSYSNSSPLRK
jgi:hypothetical protein